MDPAPASSQAAAVPGLSTLWARTRGDPGVCIAVLDGPVDRGHPSFGGARLDTVATLAASDRAAAACAASGEATGAALDHGTHVASVIFGNHDGPVAGIAPGCRGLIVPIFGGAQAEDRPVCSEIDLARAITQAAQHGAHVINISAGVAAPHGDAHDLLRKAIDWCERQHILVVAAAGNSGRDTVDVPAALPWVIAVGAMDRDGTPLESSNWGARYRDHGLLAPGDGIAGAAPGGGVTRRSGSSMAAAIVSGIAGLLLSEQRRAGAIDAARVRDALLRGARPCTPGDGVDCGRTLGGFLDVARALALVQRKNSVFVEGVTPMSEMNSDQAAGEERAITPSCGCGGSSSGNGGSSASGVTAASCGCQGSQSGTPPFVYALGTIGYDVRSEARRDAFTQRGVAHPEDAAEMLAYLAESPSSAEALTWTLNQEDTALYAIKPAGPFAAETYVRLRECLRMQVERGADHVSMPGVLRGQARLANGQVLPVVVPDLRGIYAWTVGALVDAVAGPKPEVKPGAKPGPTEDHSLYESRVTDVSNFLERVYYEVRNLGLAPQDRAINYAATNAFQVEYVFRSSIDAGLKLDTIEVERSPICRPESDCWDVKLTFFNPSRRLEQARLVYRFTIDVSDVVPVTVGKIRAFHVY